MHESQLCGGRQRKLVQNSGLRKMCLVYLRVREGEGSMTGMKRGGTVGRGGQGKSRTHNVKPCWPL